MLRRTVRWILSQWAYYSIKRNCDFSVGKGSKVNYRAIAGRTPQKVVIGVKCMIQASIIADRSGASVVIGDRTFIGGSKLIAAQRIEVGSDVLISWGCTIVDHDSHPLHWEDRKNDVVEFLHGRKDWSKVKISPVKICDRAWIGFGVTILEGVTIGEGAVIGAASVVTKDVAPYTVVAGSPARIIKTLQASSGD